MFDYELAKIMLIRDWFAGQALARIAERVWGDGGDEAEMRSRNKELTRFIAEASYLYADAMLAEREKEINK